MLCRTGNHLTSIGRTVFRDNPLEEFVLENPCQQLCIFSAAPSNELSPSYCLSTLHANDSRPFKNSDGFWRSCYRGHLARRLWAVAHEHGQLPPADSGCQQLQRLPTAKRRRANTPPGPQRETRTLRYAVKKSTKAPFYVLPTLLYLAIEGSQGMRLPDSPPDKMTP